ncbi:MAG: cadherin repeat domain-containing protein, partial [Oscillospiraceae bacterium]|nr:cadherin repeat domain-containing protein [Oscillospiraceae bacterium]
PTNPNDTCHVPAVEANQTELMAYFKDYAKFTTTLTKATNIETVSFKLNPELTDAQLTALDKKYETLISNMGLGAKGANLGTDTTYVYRSPASNDTEVVFTKAITSKTYKGSKTTKKGKLKKNQTIQFTAETPNGTAVKYKLVNVNTSKITINSTTGKVTLKKGLAKGTYKFKVKAYIPGAGALANEVQSVTIKVKK